MAEQFLTYKGKPLVRKGNTVYYGDMSEKYVIKFTVLSEKEENGQKLPERVLVELMLSDTELKPADRVKKKSEKIGLYNAMDIGSIWLERTLAEK